MSVFERIVAFLVPSLAEPVIEEHHFQPEHDEHLQWMKGQRLESERVVRERRGREPNWIEHDLLQRLERTEGYDARFD